MEYTLSIEPEGVVDSNVDSDPLTCIQGDQHIVPAPQRALEGMQVGETKEVSVSPKDGFGERSQRAFQEVNKNLVPEKARMVGIGHLGRDERGGIAKARVAEVRDETVVLDLNHPLAGKTLQFSVRVLDIREPSV
jgi:FKBP-type peptidyl-prolyl cis-trans isomerase 2